MFPYLKPFTQVFAIDPFLSNAIHYFGMRADEAFNTVELTGEDQSSKKKQQYISMF